MSLMVLARWGGLAAMVGGALEIVVGLFAPTPGPPSLVAGNAAVYQAAVLLGVVGSPLLAAGLAGLYARVLASPGPMPGPTRILATAGVVLALLAVLAPLLAVLRVLTAGSLLLDDPAPVGLLGLPLATILLGVAALLSGALGRLWRLLPLALGVATLLGLPFVPAGLGWIALGFVLWRTGAKDTPASTPGERTWSRVR